MTAQFVGEENEQSLKTLGPSVLDGVAGDIYSPLQPLLV